MGVMNGCAAGLNDIDGSFDRVMEAAELKAGRDVWFCVRTPRPCAVPDSAGTFLVASSNASLGGPQEKPIKYARFLSKFELALAF